MMQLIPVLNVLLTHSTWPFERVVFWSDDKLVWRLSGGGERTGARNNGLQRNSGSFQRGRGIYGKRIRFASKASIGYMGVFSLIETGKEQYMARKANFKLVSECNWKNTFFNLPNVHV